MNARLRRAETSGGGAPPTTPSPDNTDRGYWTLTNNQRCLLTYEQHTGHVYALLPNGGRWWLATVPNVGTLDLLLHGWEDAVQLNAPLRWVTNRLGSYDGLNYDTGFARR